MGMEQHEADKPQSLPPNKPTALEQATPIVMAYLSRDKGRLGKNRTCRYPATAADASLDFGTGLGALLNDSLISSGELINNGGCPIV